MSFVSFIDITGASAGKAPLVSGGLRAYYVTGTDDIEETAAQIAAAKTAGMTIVLIDQTPSLSSFAAGAADIADVESGAGTPAAAAAAVAARQAKGIANHTLYVSYSSLSELQAAIKSPTGVWYGVADYSWSDTDAETLLNENADWGYCQYGDPESNPATLVPGTNVTLEAVNADIDIAKSAWADLFLPAVNPYGIPAACEGAYRWVMETTNSFADFAVYRGTSVLGLLAVSAAKLNAKNAAALNAYVIGAGVNSPMPKGLVVYTADK